MEIEDKRKSRSTTYYDIFWKLAGFVVVALAVSSFVIATLAYVNVRDLESRVNSLNFAPPPAEEIGANEEIRAKRENNAGWYYYVQR